MAPAGCVCLRATAAAATHDIQQLIHVETDRLMFSQTLTLKAIQPNNAILVTPFPPVGHLIQHIMLYHTQQQSPSWMYIKFDSK